MAERGLHVLLDEHRAAFAAALALGQAGIGAGGGHGSEGLDAVVGVQAVRVEIVIDAVYRVPAHRPCGRQHAALAKAVGGAVDGPVAGDIDAVVEVVGVAADALKAVERVRSACQRQIGGGVAAEGIGVVGAPGRIAAGAVLHRVAALHAARAAGQEQAVSLLLRYPVGQPAGQGVDPGAVHPGDVHEVVAAVAHAHDVPGVGAGRVAADHEAAHAGIKGGALAQIGEGHGVALADHVGFGIAVEHPDQLPGVLIGQFPGVAGGGVVVRHPLADFMGVAEQLRIIRTVGIAVDDGLCVGGGRLGAGDHAGVDGIFDDVVLGILRSILLQHRQGDGDVSVPLPVTDGVFSAVMIEDSDGGGALWHGDRGIVPVKPIQLIGAVTPQGIQDAVEVIGVLIPKCGVQRAEAVLGRAAVFAVFDDHTQVARGEAQLAQHVGDGNPNDRGGQVAVCDPDDGLLQRAVDDAVLARQLAAGVVGGHQHAPAAAIKESPDVTGEQRVRLREVGEAAGIGGGFRSIEARRLAIVDGLGRALSGQLRRVELRDLGVGAEHDDPVFIGGGHGAALCAIGPRGDVVHDRGVCVHGQPVVRAGGPGLAHRRLHRSADQILRRRGHEQRGQQAQRQDGGQCSLHGHILPDLPYFVFCLITFDQAE